jgi:large subunit ribosomal protein L9
VRATTGVEAQASAMRKSRDVRDAADRSAAQEIATRLVPTVITITARASGEGKLYGSVTLADIAEAIEAQTGIEIDRRRLHLDEPIKTTGQHQLAAKLHAEVEFPVTVDVVAG